MTNFFWEICSLTNSQNVSTQKDDFLSRLCDQTQWCYIVETFNMSQMNPKLTICPQYCILSSTTVHSRSLPLKVCLFRKGRFSFVSWTLKTLNKASFKVLKRLRVKGRAFQALKYFVVRSAETSTELLSTYLHWSNYNPN